MQPLELCKTQQSCISILLPCIQVNKLLIDIREFILKIPLISLLIKICQTLKHSQYFRINCSVTQATTLSQY